MNSERIVEVTSRLIADHFGVSNVNQNDRLVNDLGADELDVIELVMALEEAFNIDIPDEEAYDKFHTVQSVYECVINKTQSLIG